MRIENILKLKITTILSLMSRQKNAIVTAAAFFVIGVTLAPWGAVHAQNIPPGTVGIKWHPGHYYTLMSWGKDYAPYLSDVYSELKATPALRGVQIRYVWSELETSKGVYDFSSIDKRLKELSAIGKRLIVQVQTKVFDPDLKLVPSYMRTAEYEWGEFAFSAYGSTVPKGYNIKLWNSNVRDRLIALFNAMGARYNAHPYFEGIGMIESAPGQAINPLTDAQVNGYFDNMLIVQQKMRLQFPNTMTIQEANYPRPQLPDLISGMEKIGTALGCPDIFIEEPGLLYPGTKYSPPGVYTYFSKLSGIIPLAPTAEEPNYYNTKGDGTGYQPTIHEMLRFARDDLKANYIFWTRNPPFYKELLEVLSWKNQRLDPTGAGGLNPACPSSYPACLD